MNLTKEDLLLAAEAAEQWPRKTLVHWTIKDSYRLRKSLTIEESKPGYA